MYKQKSFKIVFSLVVALVVAIVGLQLSTTPAYAGWVIPLPGGNDDVCVGFGCDGDPIIGSDWLKQRWEEIGQGPASAMAICQEVGATTCADPEFINAFQILHAGQWAGMYYDVDGCVATGFSLNDGGHQAAQIIALYYGVAIPSEIMNFSQEMHDSHIVAACQYLFDDTYNVNNIEYVDEGVYAKQDDVDGIRSQIRGNNGGGATIDTDSGTAGIDTEVEEADGLSFRNNTYSTVWLVLGYKDSSDNWVSRGWYSINAGETKSIVPGDLQHRYYYFYAYTEDGSTTWSGDYGFWMNPNEVFGPVSDSLDDNEAANSGLVWQGFQEIDTGDYSTYTLNLNP